MRFRTDPVRISGSRVTFRNVGLGELLHIAYNLPANNSKEYQISGLPSWAAPGGDYYDVEARAPGEGAPSVEQVRLMLQTLIADRFQLKIHRESRETPVYDLVIGRTGPMMKKMPTDAPWPPLEALQRRNPMQDINMIISKSLDRLLIDKTGLAGTFQFTDWSEADLSQASIFTLVQERLGLKLEAAKEPVEIVVIDHAEKPSGTRLD